jgi:Cu/Ag efflux pump CusA
VKRCAGKPITIRQLAEVEIGPKAKRGDGSATASPRW